ncbi:glutathione S-transferase family protein [Chachezhania sediminis]|uniref:glutathione S-transferase family protein n=1 Tax=Chachezhania sediminis TaxID=2599291 RepID=UPI00131BA996|nr:glutathione S-transferase family protein [Chachezhania sediminis]
MDPIPPAPAPYRLHYAPDNASLIVRLALEELGAPYQTVLVDRGRQAQKAPAHLRLNPAGQIPALECAEGPVFETAAILLHLADAHGALAPDPKGPDRPAFLSWLFFVSNTLHADMRILFYPGRYVADADIPILRARLTGRIAQHLALIETMASAAPGWCRADAPSVLTFYLACLLRWLALYPTDMNRSWFRLDVFPSLHAICAGLETRPATNAAQGAEGLGPTPFTCPAYPVPPEGVAL